MSQISRQSTAMRRWWENSPDIRHIVAGVFEGGGAKGVAYAGALEAMLEQGCWFGAVAGASAGAITAALIAAGLTPEQLREAASTALSLAATTPFRGLLRLRRTSGYFSKYELRNWLDGILVYQIRKITNKSMDSTVTFEQLYNATGIELNVVAANISLRRQQVFSYLDTPDCQVAEAVLASSSIPFAFESAQLAVPHDGSNQQTWHHTIVDGGVWANFPMFVFEDPVFRTANRRPERPAQDVVIGFILKDDEADEDEPDFERACFVKPTVWNKALEWRPIKRSRNENDLETKVDAKKRGRVGNLVRFPWRALLWIVGVPLWLLILLARAALNRLQGFMDNGLMENGRWPEPQRREARRLVWLIDSTLEILFPLAMGILVSAIVVCAPIYGGTVTVISFAGVLGTLGKLAETSYWDYLSVLFTLFLIVALLIPIILGITLFVMGVFANLFMLRAVRRIGYSLVRTYVAGPGAPKWASERPNVIPIKVHGINTTSFRIGETKLKAVIEEAKHDTLIRLDKILASIKHGE